ncbi:23S rRNA (guanosine(2251)-2'-O)-methyltransferase RlmB [Candidatus Kaiserbacteria bacterium RIFCSPHIGHO2_01_FULL_46_22]|uniref:23S rRNA (Guanosine(2251)-2'-O)-methyltransferase RlmB n=1 Tax=Candidatus Kaiserbacteria bacterium RIFCSPHIGHO2_01_FULL_46_22 TaxID=1798475 RepID=A0A1F6BXS2_9BACT|nr:MAG: 23S rRNA (guanosine(2251)-2'-O)-methyltransferase RlmB [Candidatus Kaiserbacteria bacterium RIFCSPHIGHO2_01_FULL_46_22]
MEIYIYGRHAVEEALQRRPDIVLGVHLASAIAIDPDLLGEYLKKGGRADDLTKRALSEIPKDAAHQGAVARLNIDKFLIPFKEFKNDFVPTQDTSIIVLGELTDPHNVGAIIRSAAAFGVSAVLIPEHRQAPINGTVIKVSTGTAFSIPLVLVGNVNSALRDLKDKGCWVYGLDMEGDAPLPTEDFRRPSVFVVGNEGKGIREKTVALCDSILTIPIHSRAESLNAAAAAATVMYAWSARHPDAVKK